MTSNKRQRELARAKAQRQQARRQAQAARKRRIWTIVGAVAGVAIVAGAMLWLLRSSSSETATPTTPTAVPTGEVSSPPASPSATPSNSTSSTVTPVVCKGAPPVRSADKTWPKPPAQTIKPTGTYTMSLATNCGDIAIQLEQDKAPITTNSMVFLADQKYFDLTGCHRVTTEGLYVLQCGSANGDGTGGPGYTLPDENLPPDEPNNYPAGTVAMANAGPGTGDSQFFIVYADTTLPPNYTIWGQVTSGLDIVRGIADAGVQGGGNDGPPAQKVVIEKATVAYKAA